MALTQPDFFRIATLAGCVLIGSQAHANTGWTGSGEAGFNKTTGNTETQTLIGSLKLGYAFTQSDYSAVVELENKKDQGVSISERYRLEQQYDLYFNASKDFYGFANLRNEQNKPTDVEMDHTLSLGIGRVLYKTEPTLLKAEAGLGYQDVTSVSNTANFDQMTGRIKLDLTHQINASYTFAQDLVYLTGSEQDKIETHTALRAALNNQLSASLSYKYRYNSNPAGTLKKTDGETNISLIYNF
jgi:putative salt-induced outer membrane protein